MRSIIVGDVHGCRLELARLISKLAPGTGDEVLAVGDFLTKGPDGSGAVRFWRDQGYTTVLGNNDQRVLRLLGGDDPEDEVVIRAARDIERFPELVDWIATWPVTIRNEAAGFIVVHGGLFPEPWSEEVAEGRRDDLLRLRNIRRTGQGWIRIPRGEVSNTDPFWAEKWDGPETVIYGHTPEPEVRRWPKAFGIDTGCVYGNELTAAVRIDGRWEFASEPATRVWYEA